MFKSDSTLALDAITVGYDKSLSDEAMPSELISKGFFRSLSEAGSFSDVLLLVRAKFFYNAAIFNDVRRMDFHKFIAEGLAVTDDLDGEATAEDDQEMSFVKVRSNLASATDLAVLSQGKSINDTIGSTDSGSLLGQGYVEVGYFLEDYVGYSRSF